MRSFISRFFRSVTIAATIGCVGSGMTARADDTEIFFNSTSSSGSNANILLILDTSGSMNITAMSVGTGEIAPYDNEEDYSNGSTGCDDNLVYYWPTGNGATPTTCASSSGIASFPRNRLRCIAATNAIDGPAGYYGGTDRFIRWGGTGNSKGWSPNMAVSNGRDVECFADNGIHGSDSSSSNKRPTKNLSNDNNGVWVSAAASQWWSATNVGTQLYLFSPNYIRYNANPPTVETEYSRLDVVKTAVATLLNSVSNVNVGLIRYDTDAHGGMVMAPIQPLTDTYRDDLISTVNGFLPAGGTPLSETYFEAYNYLAGKDVQFGETSEICTAIGSVDSEGNAYCGLGKQASQPSVDASRTSPGGDTYKSPFIDADCGANTYIIYLTDGLPTSDNEANDDIETLTENTCGTGNGVCLATLAAYMRENNIGGTANTSVTSYFIGFGDDFSTGSTGFDYLSEAAVAGGGKAHSASDIASLTSVFNSILNDVADINTTFTAPSVAVNAFNRTQNLNDLFVSVFSPTVSRHWEGNLKKYRIVDGEILDQIGDPAVQDGFFAPGARSFWSDTDDGSDVAKGGAANELPAPSARIVYTYLDSNPSSADTLGTADRISTANAALTDALFDLSGATDEPTKTQLIDWLNGQDVQDLNDNGSTTDARLMMGDPIHSPPAAVIYGGTETNPDIVTFVATNDGYLHAFDGSSWPADGGGSELWAFIPKQVLPEMKELYANDPSESKQYLLDGEIQILKYDVDQDGVVESPNDRVILYVSQGRGGDYYYALDVTEKNSPAFMWGIGSSVLNGMQQSWSKPVLARINIAGATQNSQKLVLIIGGGYDSAEDGQTYVTADTHGNRIYFVDALKGTVLWWAGPSGSGANLELARMDHAIPGSISVLDTDADGYADRMYASDTSAQMWRFDIHNGNGAGGSGEGALVTGGVIASVGAHDLDPVTAANARRFYSKPDVALISDGQSSFYNIAIGSGHRGHPLDTNIEDWFYSIRDYRPYRPMTQDQYDDYDIITHGDLDDITDDVEAILSANSPGWRLELENSGEKSLGSANTLDNTVLFTTYTPNDGSDAEDSCTVQVGTNLAYAVSVFNGAPVKNLRDLTTDEDGELTKEDRSIELDQGGIAPEISTVLTEESIVCEEGDTDCTPCDANTQECETGATCTSGGEVIPEICSDFGTRYRSYWRDSSSK